MGSPTKIAPGPPACSAAYWASAASPEGTAMVAVGSFRRGHRGRWGGGRKRGFCHHCGGGGLGGGFCYHCGSRSRRGGFCHHCGSRSLRGRCCRSWSGRSSGGGIGVITSTRPQPQNQRKGRNNNSYDRDIANFHHLPTLISDATNTSAKSKHCNIWLCLCQRYRKIDKLSITLALYGIDGVAVDCIVLI